MTAWRAKLFGVRHYHGNHLAGVFIILVRRPSDSGGKLFRLTGFSEKTGAKRASGADRPVVYPYASNAVPRLASCSVFLGGLRVCLA